MTETENITNASAGKGFLQAAVFVLFLAGAFIFLGHQVTEIQGAGMKELPAGINVERGEDIFWNETTGVCNKCHMIGGKGSMKRGPNLGESEFGPTIFERAAARAKERASATGEDYSALDYIIESLADPNAYVVDKFPKNLMPKVYTGQTDLSAEQVMSVIAYLQSLTTEVDIPAIQKAMKKFGKVILEKEKLPEDTSGPSLAYHGPEWEILRDYPELLAKYRDLDTAGRKSFLETDLSEEQKEEIEEEASDWIDEGREVFEEMKCWQCHTIQGEEFGELGDPGTVGPDLTGIADIQPPEYLRESVLNPNAVIVPPKENHQDDEGKTKMPDYWQSLTLYQVDRLVYFLSSLTSKGEEKE